MRTLSVRAAIAAFVGLAASAGATPLKMEYCVTPVGTLFEYKITLTLDNNDGSWAPGNGFSWLIFGDAQSATSPLNDFVIDPGSFPVGPFTQLGGSGGFHNGPTFHPIWIVVGQTMNFWIPTAIGDKLEWKGTSAANLAQGQMLWSNLWITPGTVAGNFTVATLLKSCGGGGCYPDCNGDTVLTVADFGCFQTKFVQGDPYADCNGDTFLTVADFGCFQTKFVQGCN